MITLQRGTTIYLYPGNKESMSCICEHDITFEEKEIEKRTSYDNRDYYIYTFPKPKFFNPSRMVHHYCWWAK